MRTVLMLTLTLLTQTLPALAEEPGCPDSRGDFLPIGALRHFERGRMMCTKTADGAYEWVVPNEYDLTRGCWGGSLYPAGSIVKMADGYRECVGAPGSFRWVPAAACRVE